jgi:hypothetical protein
MFSYKDLIQHHHRLPTIATGDPSGPNFNATPQQLAKINTQAFSPNVNLSSITGNITTWWCSF